jgi:hypothetical protein
VPLIAEQETTYTITWSATNLLNDVNNAKVVATLPSYVKWNDLVSSSVEDVQFNSSTNEVIWNIGGIKGGTGMIYYPREVSFNVSFTPSLSQVGEKPEILGQATIIGTDSFTGVQVGDTRPGVTTDIVTDPSYQRGQGTVNK